jgi:hypothetical protein
MSHSSSPLTSAGSSRRITRAASTSPGKGCDPDWITSGDSIEVVHRASVHRAPGLFELGEKASVVEQRRLVAKRPCRRSRPVPACRWQSMPV